MAAVRPAPAPDPELEQRCINTIRTLAMDAVQKANSGHPGLPMGAAAMAFVLWTRFLRHNPQDPAWPDRDRFVLSAGHGSMLLYALLHLCGYDLSLEDIRQFRQWGSRTPGHPEHGHTAGVETTTGPLGQGLATAVGMAVAERWLAARFNRPGHTLVDHRTYVLASDGDLMEGVAAEAASLAGHLRLGKLIVLYDDNRISLDGPTDWAFTEDRCARFAAYGWHVQQVEDGNDTAAVARAIAAATSDEGRPHFIAVRTHIGFGSPHKQDTSAAHGAPLGAEEVRRTKEALGWPADSQFLVPDDVRAFFRQALARGRAAQAEWDSGRARYARAHAGLAAAFDAEQRGERPSGWEDKLPRFAPGGPALATRAASREVLNAVAPVLGALLGGSADLSESTYTMLEGYPAITAEDFSGKNLNFGVREHAMAAICNGMALHGGVIPYAGTFLVFSDYMRPAIRLAALMGVPVTYVFTHDSIALGEDGPTHQPIEHLASLRAIPGLTVLRPADANETAGAWQYALTAGHGPTALVLSRQKLPVLPGIRREGVLRGGYVVSEGAGEPRIVLIGTGSELQVALAAADILRRDGVAARVVSLPSWELFAAQEPAYRDSVLPPGVPRLAVEAGATLGWCRFADDVVGIDRFGASAPGEVNLAKFGFTGENVAARARELLGRR
jgi:transketolase